MRPIGGIVIGRIGDRRGRKPAMILSFWLMGIAIAGLALTPSYATIGLAAPVLLIFFRLLQGFALGGDVGPATALLLETAPPERRGFYAALQVWTQSLATLVSGLVGFGLVSMLSASQLQVFGWRIALLSGAVIVPFGLLVRRSLPETFHSSLSEGERAPLKPYLWVAVLGFLLLAYSVGNQVMSHMTTYALTTLRMRANVAFAATIVVGVSGVGFNILGGALSDRVGRKPLMLLLTSLLAILILPCFHMIVHYRTAATFLVATAVLASLRSLGAPLGTVWLAESVPPAIRSASVGFIYAIGIALFGGTTQYVVAWLIKTTGNPLAPAWYWTAAMIVALTATFAIRESAPRKVARNASPTSQFVDEIVD